MTRIIVDLDSIIVDFLGGLWEAYAKVGGERITTDQILSWDMTAYAQDSEKMRNCFMRPGFFYNLKPIPGAIDGLHQLKDSGFDIVIATTPVTTFSAEEKMDWCYRYLRFIPQKDVVVIHRKELLTGDIFIDDAPHNAYEFRKNFPKSLILTIAYPYNKSCGAYNVRFQDHKTPVVAWADMVRFIKDYVRGA